MLCKNHHKNRAIVIQLQVCHKQQQIVNSRMRERATSTCECSGSALWVVRVLVLLLLLLRPRSWQRMFLLLLLFALPFCWCRERERSVLSSYTCATSFFFFLFRIFYELTEHSWTWLSASPLSRIRTQALKSHDTIHNVWCKVGVILIFYYTFATCFYSKERKSYFMVSLIEVVKK